MKKLKELYQKYYYISPLDMADSAESNRIFNLYWSIGWFIFILGLFIFMLIRFKNNYYDYQYYFIYLAVALPDLLISFILSITTKNVSREKAYIFKNIPFYIIFAVCGVSGTIMLFYLQENHYNALLLFILATNSVLCALYITLPFFIILIAAFIAMIPGTYQFWGIMGTLYFSIMMVLLLLIAFLCRYRQKQQLSLLKKQKKSLEAKTFGNFTILYEDKNIKFSRTKSTELLAYLIYKNGSSVSSKELISALWGDYADSAKYGSFLRNLISDIRKTFEKLEIQNFFVAEYNSFRINPEVVHCDYYDFLAGDKNAKANFVGEFMSQYSWAEDIAGFLERKILNN
ncbi:MAG: hypothetical protein K5839_00095 [Treponemataceae bacterium]|nr:hypothetical protein [Treponemataceae bacterium]